MPYSATYDGEAGLIALSFRGKVDLPALRKLASDAARISKEHNCFLVLSDFREATLSLSTMEIYTLPKTLSEILSASGINVYRFKRALVMSTDIDDFTFFETVSRNRSQNITLFRDVDEAKKWLLRK